MNPSKTKGTAFESAIVRYLTENGHPHAERRALAGAADRGDIAGLPGVMIEAKAVKTITLASIMDEVVEQTANCGDGTIGVAWIKRRGKGIERSYVVMEPATFLALLGE
jgi:Holliday junction resolvase